MMKKKRQCMVVPSSQSPYRPTPIKYVPKFIQKEVPTVSEKEEKMDDKVLKKKEKEEKMDDKVLNKKEKEEKKAKKKKEKKEEKEKRLEERLFHLEKRP